MPRLPSYLLVALAATVLATGCHGITGDAPTEGKLSDSIGERLPIEPEDAIREPAAVPEPWVKPWRQPKVPGGIADWQLAIAELDLDGWRVTYRAPIEWDVDLRGRTRSSDGLVRAQVSLTPLEQDSISVVAHAASIAEGSQAFLRRTTDGHAAYLVAREVSVAPSDPDTERWMFHTAVVDVDGRIAKLDVIYDADLRWRFYDLANAIIGTIEVDQRT